MRRRLIMPALFASLTACADFEGVTSSTGGLPDLLIEAPRFQQDIQPIFERRCSIGGCHSEMSHQGGLYLTRDSAYSALVGRPSRLFVGEVLVRPGDPNNSWLVIAIRDDAARRRGLARMPLGSGALTPNQIQNIVNWINRGAPDD
jgi:hypothetical protein